VRLAEVVGMTDDAATVVGLCCAMHWWSSAIAEAGLPPGTRVCPACGMTDRQRRRTGPEPQEPRRRPNTAGREAEQAGTADQAS
jgi:hypothetical protein